MPRPFRLPRPSRSAITALGAGLLVALSLPPWGIWPLAFVGIALFEVSLGERPTRGQRAARGWLFAAGWMFPGLFFLWYLSEPGYIVAAAIFAGYHSLAALAAPTGPWRVIGRPAAHTLAEAARFVFPFGGVPVASLAIGQASGPLLGVVRVGGSLLLTWVVFQIGFALAGPSPYVPALAARRGGRSRRAAPHGAIAIGAVVVVVVLAAVAPSGHDRGQSLRVAAVQGGGPQGTRASNTNPRDVVERHLAATQTIQPGSVDLVVWPENVIDVADFSTSRELGDVTEQAARIGAPFAVGITDDVYDDDGRDVAFRNAQVVVTPDGRVTARYDKVRRVPYGEYVPLRGVLAAFGAPVDQVPRDARAGTGPAYIDLPGGQRLGVVISWEVFFGNRARDGAQHDADVIVNPTNGSSYTGTVLQTQQVASSRLRAVETGRWVVQVAPTGFSAFIDDEGHVHQRTAVSEQRVIVDDVPLRSGRTWYTVLGDWPFVLLVALVFGLAWWGAAGRPLRPRSSA
ncbi:MAG: apolipoprotein N-acyltransferase [Actinobacteria bacterium]|nr:apolipoprotein N-acyltransferase [Actinomycetota bacterium]